MSDGMKACPECAEEVKAAAKLCRYCGYRFVVEEHLSKVGEAPTATRIDDDAEATKTHRTLYIIMGLLTVGALIFAYIAGRKQDAAEAQKYAANAPKLIPVTEEVKEKRRKGLHCLGGADGSNLAVVEAVKVQLVDPDSFQHIGTTIYPANMLEHRLVMQFRSRNGFNGMVQGKAIATVSQINCQISLKSVS